MTHQEAIDRLIVALDFSDRDKTLDLVDELAQLAGYFKVGLQLFSAHGPPIVEEILSRQGRLFLDLKLHDIPNTVARAVEQAAELGVDMLTLHTMGGGAMLKAARIAVDNWSQRTGRQGPQLLGVTVLTGMDQQELASVGHTEDLPSLVLRLAHLAQDSGLDGLVCSPREVRRLREGGIDGLRFVTPGIRPGGSPTDDQKRISTPSDAIRSGTDYIVVGRPITAAPSPLEATQQILNEISSVTI